jgi:hypothetical protein
VNFDPQGARYVALRWTPAAGNARGFEIAEINAFGDMPLSMLNTSGAPDVYASNTIGTRPPGDGGPDRIDPLATFDPPVIPAVSE